MSKFLPITLSFLILLFGCSSKKEENITKDNIKNSESFYSENLPAEDSSTIVLYDKRLGFRGITWGTDISNFDSMVECETDIYRNEKDKMRIGDIKLEYIEYETYLGKLMGVKIKSALSNEDDDVLSKAVAFAYNIPKDKDDNDSVLYEDENIKVFAWRGYVEIKYIPLFKEKEKYLKDKIMERAKKAKDDF